METTSATGPSRDGGRPDGGHRARGDVPDVPRMSWWDRLWRPFWALPAACVVLALVVGVGLPQVEDSWGATRLRYVFQGGPDGAREVLGTVASAMISVTGLVFSITMVVLQLASSQFTPRVLGGFLQSRTVQGTLGVFIATFVFALTVTRYVRGDNETEQFVPQVSVTLAFLLVLACMGYFLAFIHHITRSIQVSHVISGIGDRTLEVAHRLYPQRAGDEAPTTGPTWSPTPAAPSVPVPSRRHGVVTQVDYAALVEWARARDVVVTVDHPVGAFVVQGQQVMRVWGAEELDAGDAGRAGALVRLGTERELRQDVGFGIRQLVDIAVRALSPGVNDPTTAVQCLDELHRILRHLVQQVSPSPYVSDGEGRVRVAHRPQSISDLVELAVLEVAHYGDGDVQVPRRLRDLLEDLRDVAADPHRATVDTLLDRLPGDDQDRAEPDADPRRTP